MTPLNLQNTAALRGETRRWTLLIRSHGRTPYLHRAVGSIDETVGLERFSRLVASFDGPPVELPAADREWDVYSTGPRRSGLSANIRQARAVLDDGWVLDVEEDFVIADAPLDEMADTLEANPHVAQMALLRQPWSPEEHAAGSVLRGPILAGTLTPHDGWMEQARLYTYNPHVARASLLVTLAGGVESETTAECLARGLTFGVWGQPDDPPRCEHIGEQGGMGTEGWTP